MEGYGTMYFKEGGKYVGEFSNGEFNGIGHYYLVEGAYGKAEFMNN